MPDNLSFFATYKEYVLAALAGIIAAIAGWFDMKRRVVSNQKELIKISKSIDTHLQDHKNARFISETQHDRLQADCQKLWLAEFVHIRSTLDKIETDIREMRSRRENFL